MPSKPSLPAHQCGKRALVRRRNSNLTFRRNDENPLQCRERNLAILLERYVPATPNPSEKQEVSHGDMLPRTPVLVLPCLLRTSSFPIRCVPAAKILRGGQYSAKALRERNARRDAHADPLFLSIELDESPLQPTVREKHTTIPNPRFLSPTTRNNPPLPPCEQKKVGETQLQSQVI